MVGRELVGTEQKIIEKILHINVIPPFQKKVHNST